MATKGSAVKFVYLRTGVRPTSPDQNTVYFAPESKSIFVGDTEMVNGKKIQLDLDQLGTTVHNLEEQIGRKVEVEIVGEGNVIVDAELNTETYVLTLTKGQSEELIWDVIEN